MLYLGYATIPLIYAHTLETIYMRMCCVHLNNILTTQYHTTLPKLS